MNRKQRLFLTLLMMANITVFPWSEEWNTAAAQELQTEVTTQAQAASEELEAQVASADEMVVPENVVSEDMVPVYADSLNEGTYEIEVISSSSMFKIADCQLSVKDGEMSAVLTIASDSYLKLFPGTGTEAVEASEEEYITFELDEEGNQRYTMPVAALDMGTDCAAWSRRKEKWYDRTLVFSASTLPQDAFKEGWILSPEEIGLEDGTYTVDVTLGGAAGKTAVETPAVMTVKDGEVTAVISLNSSNYDYILIDGEKFEQINEEGNSSFEIPVTGFDWDMPIKADSVALRTPRELDYTLYFDALSIQKKNTGIYAEESKYESDTSGSTSAADSSTGLSDGVYTPDKFSWSGGSGRTSISCTKVTVSGGQAYATIVFGSSNYGYVKANGNIYYPTYGSGTSTFTIPVNLNANNRIIGMTTAMSAAHEITYTIYIYIAGADASSSSKEAKLNDDTLSEEAPEIIGLKYSDEANSEYAEYFKIYYYDQGITLIEVDMATDTDKPEEESETEEETAAQGSLEDGSEDMDTEEEIKDSLTLISELYQEDIVRYLVVPEDAEIPVGLEKEMIIIHVPVESVYTDSVQALEVLKNLKLEDLVKAEGEAAEKPEYKELILNQCDLAILSCQSIRRKLPVAGSEGDEFLWDAENEELTIEEQSELLYEITERLATLDIPAIVDRSADEKSEEAAAEWIKVYGVLFRCTDAAEALYQETLQQ